jgi:hypothetical protein
VDVDVEAARQEVADLVLAHAGPGGGDGAGRIAEVEDDVAVGAGEGAVDVHHRRVDDVVHARQRELRAGLVEHPETAAAAGAVDRRHFLIATEVEDERLRGKRRRGEYGDKQ